MNERPCIRCHHSVLLEDGHLVFCSHCGAPQIFLSEELQSEIAENARTYQERNHAADAADSADSIDSLGSSGSVPPNVSGRFPLRSRHGGSARSPWTLAVQYALLSAAIALGLGLLSLLFPPLILFVLLWVVSAPVLTVTLYNARAQAGPPTGSGFAARMGLLTGLLVAFGCAIVFTLSLVLSRFVFHDAALLDAQIAAGFAQQRTVLLQRIGAGAQPTIDILGIPEFRVGMMLSVTATSTSLYLILSTLAAGVTGLVLRRRPNA